MSDNGTSVDARDGRNALTSTPFAQALNSSPVTVLLSVIRNNNTHTLNVGRLEVFQQSMFVSGRGWNTIVADKRLREDENLSTVRGIGHRLGVSNKRGREDRLARNVRLGAERLAVEDWTILENAKSARSSATPPIVSYPDCECSSVVGDGCGPVTSRWHGTASTAFDGG